MAWDGVERRHINLGIPRRRKSELAIEVLKYVSASLITLACFTVIQLTSTARTAITRQEVIEMIDHATQPIYIEMQYVRSEVSTTRDEVKKNREVLEAVQKELAEVRKHQPQVVYRKYIYPRPK